MDVLEANSLPWLKSAQARIRQATDRERLPHSLLILSPPGLGAEALAGWAGGLALCMHKTRRPCGECASCQLLRANSHPDLHVVRLEEDAQQIKVEQVRALIDALWFKSYRGGYKVGIIESAEALNQSGANAFLKTLEEPAQNTLLIIIARPTHRLPATIASRCLKISLRAPPSNEAAAWLGQRATPKDWSVALKLTGGAPLAALELEPTDFTALEREMSEDLGRLCADSTDITLVAGRWLKADPGLRIAWLENWITARVLGQSMPGGQSQTAEPVRLPAALLKPKMRGLFELLDAAREFRRLASTSVNQQLALEALLLGGRKVLIDAKSQ